MEFTAPQPVGVETEASGESASSHKCTIDKLGWLSKNNETSAGFLDSIDRLPPNDAEASFIRTAIVETLTISGFTRNLIVRQTSMDLTVRTYEITRGFPSEERYGLTSQMRRAAASVPAFAPENAGGALTAERRGCILDGAALTCPRCLYHLLC